MKTRLLDLFCGAGGAGMGYHRAGFEVVGVDIKPQPHYPFEFHQVDALEYLQEHHQEFDAFHASPPCQEYSVLASVKTHEYPKLVEPARSAFIALGKPYVIENVPGAPLNNPVTLCGSAFGLRTSKGLQLRRHRLFETSFDILFIPPCQHCGKVVGIFGDKARDTGAEKRHYSQSKEERGKPDGIKVSLEDARLAMGIEWMNFKELSQAIPPVYTEFIGKHLLRALIADKEGDGGGGGVVGLGNLEVDNGIF